MEDHSLSLVSFPYVILDWSGCTNILFTEDELVEELILVFCLIKRSFNFIVFL